MPLHFVDPNNSIKPNPKSVMAISKLHHLSRNPHFLELYTESLSAVRLMFQHVVWMIGKDQSRLYFVELSDIKFMTKIYKYLRKVAELWCALSQRDLEGPPFAVTQ